MEVECRSVASARRSKGSRRSNNSRRRRSRGGGGCQDNEDGSNPYLFFSRDTCEVELDEEGFAIPSSRPSTSKAKSASSSAYRPKSLFSSTSGGASAGSGAPYRKAAVSATSQNKKLRKKLGSSSDDGNSSDSAAECGWQAFCTQSLAKRRGHQSLSPCVSSSSGGESAAAAAAICSERRLSPMPSPSLLPTIELLPGATNIVVETDLCSFFLESC